MTESQESIQRLQMIEQNVQGLNMQKQQFQAQMFEVESALKELETSSVTYKIIAGVMIGVDKEKLKKELAEMPEKAVRKPGKVKKATKKVVKKKVKKAVKKKSVKKKTVKAVKKAVKKKPAKKAKKKTKRKK